MHVLITGGAGFIGSHLADGYITRGDTVFVVYVGDPDGILEFMIYPVA